MNAETRAAALAHAAQEFPRESCGLVVLASGAESYFPCRNLAEGESQFVMDPADLARAEDLGELRGVVHSHPNASSRPSQADLVSCESSGLPWHIVSMPDGVWHSFAPSGYRAPLLGREFSIGILDCYTLIRDWYREERGIELPDFERTDKFWERGEDLYLENFERAGFVKVEGELLPGDAILMQINSPVVNHGAVYLGDDVMLHHVGQRLSTREVYGGYWRKRTRMVARYAGAMLSSRVKPL